MAEKLLAKHHFVFNKKDNGGEALELITKFYDNGDGEIFTNQEIKLNSYGNSASIELCGVEITPDLLRELANRLESAKLEVKSKL